MKFHQSSNRTILLLLICIPLLFQACKQSDSTTGSTEDPLYSQINQYLDWEEENGFSGIISIKIKDKPIFSRSIGYANNDKLTPITSQTVFDIGSLTKQFTAAAILKLEMEGKLSVEDSLIKFFPEIPEDKVNITLHQLLTHTSGFKNSMGYDYKRVSRSDFLSNLFLSELDSIPGTKYNYSHAGYSLLGVVIEVVSGMNYEEYVHEKIFDPAGMEHTGYVIPFWEEDKVAHGYRKCRDWGKPMDMPWTTDGPYWNLKANGGLISSSEDLLNWIDVLEENEVLSESAKEKFFYPHVREVREGERAVSHYSYGWVIMKSTRDTDVMAHEGGNRRFYTDLLRYISEDVTILLLSNKSKPGNESIATEIARIIFWPDYKPEVQGVIQDCLDSLPDNRIGEVAGNFLTLINEEIPLTDFSEVEGLFADYLKNKYTPDHILEYLNKLKEKYRKISIDYVVVTNNQIMDINLLYQTEEGNRKKLYLKLIFDEEDDYLIRWIWYDTRNR